MENKVSISKKGGFFSFLANDLISSLPERSQEIVKKRFGLEGERPLTLEKIGRDYSITRERVRQILADSQKKACQKDKSGIFKKAEDKIIFTINGENGILRLENVIEKLAKKDDLEENSIRFFVSCSEKIKTIPGNDFLEEALFIDKKTLNKVKEVSNSAFELLEKEGKILSKKNLESKVSKQVSLQAEEIKSYLEVLKKIKENKFGKWGISDWREIRPKNTKDKIYLVLKERSNPLHFGEIATLIDEYGLSKRKAHPQTVHNELIKDSRFVLIGRGIYALSEWGYKKGTIRDVLEEILKKEGPMDREMILEKVLKMRKVKKATVIINLNNSRFFLKENSLYAVKK